MTKEQGFVVSSGKIIILWQLIYLVSQYKKMSIQELSSMIQESGALGGTVPFDDAVRLGNICKFIEFEDGIVSINSLCEDILLPLCSTKDPNTSVVRAILQRIILLSLYRFTWLLFFDKDVDAFKISIPQEWIDILDQAELFDFEQDEVEDWWNAILANVNKFDLSNTKEIGDVGEKLTVEYENSRLISDGILHPQQYLKWISRFSDNYGYDVLSIKGKTGARKKISYSPVQIEVKSTVMTNLNNFRFKISRNEWNIALENLDSYYFYFWLGVNVIKLTAADGPYVISAKSFINKIPKDQHESCEWTECRLMIDLNSISKG